MKSKHHFLAIMPILSILSLSPVELDQVNYRSIASISSETPKSVEFPKYSERVAKIDQSQITLDPDLDINCFSDRGTELRKRIMDERKQFNVDELDKEKITLQKARLDGIIQSLVSFEKDYAALVEKKAFDEFGQEIAANTIKELKTTVESLLIDDQENDLIALSDKPEEPKKEEPAPTTPEKPETPVVVAEETPEEPKKEEPAHECEMTEKNKILTDQVAELLKQQQAILQSMVSMNQMMLAQMNQGQQSYNPFANVSYYGPSFAQSMYESQLRFPSSGGTHIYIYGQQPQQQSLLDTAAQMPQQQQPQMFPYQQAPQQPMMMMDPRYSVQPVTFGDFGSGNFQFNFSQPTNMANPLPIYSA